MNQEGRMLHRLCRLSAAAAALAGCLLAGTAVRGSTNSSRQTTPTAVHRKVQVAKPASRLWQYVICRRSYP